MAYLSDNEDDKNERDWSEWGVECPKYLPDKNQSVAGSSKAFMAY